MTEAWGGVEGLPNGKSEQANHGSKAAQGDTKWSAAPESPVESNSDAYRWWARDVAASLQQAVSQDVAAPMGKVYDAQTIVFIAGI